VESFGEVIGTDRPVELGGSAGRIGSEPLASRYSVSLTDPGWQSLTTTSAPPLPTDAHQRTSAFSTRALSATGASAVLGICWAPLGPRWSAIISVPAAVVEDTYLRSSL